MTAPDVRLIPITDANWRATLLVRVSDDQMRFVADHQPISFVILAKSYVTDGGRVWHPLAVEVGNDIVGVVGVSHRETTSFMENFAVHETRQREGIGRAAVDAVIAHCQAHGSERILLTVHDDNAAAQRMYSAAGFAPTGKRPFGDPEWELLLSN